MRSHQAVEVSAIQRSLGGFDQLEDFKHAHAGNARNQIQAASFQQVIYKVSKPNLQDHDFVTGSCTIRDYACKHTGGW